LPPVIYDQILSSERRIAGIPALAEVLRDPDFITSIVNRIKKILPNSNLPLGMALNQICIFLKTEESIRGILETECESNFSETEEYHSLMFTCSLLVYVEYLKLSRKEESTGGSV
jgi:hypothetical protein